MKIKGILRNTKVGKMLKKVVPARKMTFKGGAYNHRVPASYIRDKKVK